MPIVEDVAPNVKALWKEITAATVIYPKVAKEMIKF